MLALEKKNQNVSVIIPTFNRAESISDAVDSVLGQSVPAHQIIVVDDGSYDKTPRILSSYRGKITVIRQKNSGVSVARNAGISRATGDWVGFLDSDDLWYPTRLEMFYEDLGKFNGEFIIHRVNMKLSGRSEKFEDDFSARGIMGREHNFRIMDDYFSFLCKGTPPTSSIVRRDEVIGIGGFDQSLSYGEDTLLFCALHNKGRCFFRNEILAELRRLPNDEDALDSEEKKKNVEFWRGLDKKWCKIAEHVETETHASLVRGKHAACLYRLARIQWEQTGRADLATLWRAAFVHPSRFKGLVKSAACVLLRGRGYRFSTGGGSGSDEG